MSAEPNVKDSTHTPLPWEIGQLVQNDGSIAIKAVDAEGDAVRVALADDYGAPIRGENQIPIAEGQANARLIAAAPELLEALEAQERLAEHISHCPKCIDPEHRGICAGAAAMAMPVNEKRHSAIARAKGDSSPPKEERDA